MIEVQIPEDVYRSTIEVFEYPYEGGPLTEVEIPFEVLPVVNRFRGIWHR